MTKGQRDPESSNSHESILDNMTLRFFGHPLTITQQIWIGFILPSAISTIIFVASLAIDVGVTYQLFRDGHCGLAAVTLLFVYSPAIHCLVLTLLKFPVMDNLCDTILWSIVQVFHFILFPIGVMHRFATRLFWSICAVGETDPAREEALRYASDPHQTELFFLLDAFLHAAPQALFQAYILLSPQIITTNETDLTEVLSVITSVTTLSKAAAVYQRYESQRVVGRLVPWTLQTDPCLAKALVNVTKFDPAVLMKLNSSQNKKPLLSTSTMSAPHEEQQIEQTSTSLQERITSGESQEPINANITTSQENFAHNERNPESDAKEGDEPGEQDALLSQQNTPPDIQSARSQESTSTPKGQRNLMGRFRFWSRTKTQDPTPEPIPTPPAKPSSPRTPTSRAPASVPSTSTATTSAFTETPFATPLTPIQQADSDTGPTSIPSTSIKPTMGQAPLVTETSFPVYPAPIPTLSTSPATALLDSQSQTPPTPNTKTSTEKSSLPSPDEGPPASPTDTIQRPFPFAPSTFEAPLPIQPKIPTTLAPSTPTEEPVLRSLERSFPMPLRPPTEIYLTPTPIRALPAAVSSLPSITEEPTLSCPPDPPHNPTAEIKLPKRKPRTEGLAEDEPLGMAVAFFAWWCFLFARVLAIAAISHFYQWVSLGVLLAHFVLMNVYLRYCELRPIFLIPALSQIFILCPVEVKVRYRHPHVFLVSFIVIATIEDISTTLVWYLLAKWDSWWYDYTCYTIIAGHGVAAIHAILYYFLFNPKPKYTD